jgi:carbonic anhydrase
MERLIKVGKTQDINVKHLNTPIGDLLEYHNLHKEFGVYDRAQLLIGMCMDNRKHLRIPDNFEYIIRSGVGNLRYSESRYLMHSIRRIRVSL